MSLISLSDDRKERSIRVARNLQYQLPVARSAQYQFAKALSTNCYVEPALGGFL